MTNFRIATRLSRSDLLTEANVSTDVSDIETNLERISALAEEAAEAGDDVMHGICERAAMGDAEHYVRAVAALS
jgi:hypothetical protein